MSEEAELPFSESWAMLGQAVELAGAIVSAQPNNLASFISTIRKTSGTDGERGALAALYAVRSAARAQVELAEAAIEIAEACIGLANDAAMATAGEQGRA